MDQVLVSRADYAVSISNKQIRCWSVRLHGSSDSVTVYRSDLDQGWKFQKMLFSVAVHKKLICCLVSFIIWWHKVTVFTVNVKITPITACIILLYSHD